MLFDRPHIYVTSETKCIEHCQRKQTFFAYTELKSNVSLNESEFFNGYKQNVHKSFNIFRMCCVYAQAGLCLRKPLNVQPPVNIKLTSYLQVKIFKKIINMCKVAYFKYKVTLI